MVWVTISIVLRFVSFPCTVAKLVFHFFENLIAVCGFWEVSLNRAFHFFIRCFLGIVTI